MNLEHNLSFLFILATCILFEIPGYLCQDQQYTTCRRPFQCGNIRNITYPFYGGDRPASCGHPGFELDCQSEVPLLNISSILYRVLEIVNNVQTLRVAREDLWDIPCPRYLHNTTLDFQIFDYSSNSDDQNITLHYNCPDSQGLYRNQFSCPVNGTTSSSFYVIGEVPLPRNDFVCNDNISVPVNPSAATTMSNPATSNPATSSRDVLRDALASGFSIQWSADNDNCDECVSSGGVCGYTASFACYCEDRPYSLTCNGRNGNGNRSSNNRTGSNLGMSIGFPIAGAVLAGFGLGWLIFYCKQKRKRKLAERSLQTVSKEVTPTQSGKDASNLPSTASTKSIPSFPSSKPDFGGDSSYFGVHVFSYTELEEATEHFNDSRVLGDGGFGIVYYGVLRDGRIVAVKRLYENNFKRVRQFMNELEILTRLRHQNLVTLYGCTSKQSLELLLVYEYIPNGTVADHLHGKRAKSSLLSWPLRLNIAVETAKALAYLHQSEIIHRDVKTNNILLDNDFHVKVADFGLSRLFPTDVTHVSTAPQGTPGYVDPEYYQCYRLTEKSDVYSFGVVLIELISSLQAVDTNRHRHDINLANMGINKIQNHALHELVDKSLGFEESELVRRKITLVAVLAFRCLQQDRETRPSMVEVLECLRGIQNEELNASKVDIVDIVVDDVALLMGSVDSLSSNSVVTDKSATGSNQNSI